MPTDLGRRLRRFRLTLLGLGLALVAQGLCTAAGLNPFEAIHQVLRRHEHLQLDEMLLFGLFLFPCLVMDLARERRRMRILAMREAEQLRVLRLTMNTVQDLVGNALQNLQLLHLLAEEDQGLDPKVRAEVEQVIHGMAARLRAIGELESIEVERVGSEPARLKV